MYLKLNLYYQFQCRCIGILLIGFMGGTVYSQESLATARDSANALGHFWDDPGFVARFMGNYGFKSEVEPRIQNPIELELYQSLVEVVRDNPDEAIKQLKNAIKPDSSAILDFTLGTLYLQTGQNSQALESFRVSVSKFPDFLRAHKNLGFALVKEGEFDEAVESLTKSIELGGADGNTYGLLGFALMNLEQFVSAETAYKSAILLAPRNADWKLGLVKCQVALQKYSEAIDLLNDLIDKNPESERLWELQANIHMQVNEPLKAAVNYELLRRMGKATPGQLMLLGDIYIMENSKELALQAYMEGISVDTGENTTRALRAADILVSRGAYDDAQGLLKQIQDSRGQELEGENALNILRLQAKIAMANGDGENAVNLLEQVLEKNPLDGEALILVGEYYAGKGEREKAEFQYERAEKIEGFEADALVKHAQLLVQHQKYVQAVELLIRAQKIRPRDSVQRYLEAIEQVAGRART